MTTQAIKVPVGFKDEFNFFCQHAGIEGEEMEFLRDEVRRDFDTVGNWVIQSAKTCRFIDQTWGAMPTPQQCREYLVAAGYEFDQDRLPGMGIMLQARLCMEASRAVRS